MACVGLCAGRRAGRSRIDGSLTLARRSCRNVAPHPPPSPRCIGVLHGHTGCARVGFAGPRRWRVCGSRSGSRSRIAVSHRGPDGAARSPAARLDADHATRMDAIKARFSRTLRRWKSRSGRSGIGSIMCGTRPISQHMCGIAGSTR